MSLNLTHTTKAIGSDAGDGSISKNAWNEGHTLTCATSVVLGRATAGEGAVEELAPATARGLLGLGSAALAATGDFAAAVHTHAIADVTNLQTTLDGKSTVGHGHVIADTTGLQAELDGKLALTGGTLTGGLSGTTAAFSGNFSAAAGTFSSNVAVTGNIQVKGTAGEVIVTSRNTGSNWNIYNSGGTIRFWQSGDYLTLSNTGLSVTGTLTASSTINGLTLRTSGASGIGIGANALGSATGANNVSIGANSSDALTTGTGNVAIGSGALGAETTGATNVVIGTNAGFAQNGATNNTLIGTSAGEDLTTGGGNTFVGRRTGEGITTGANNTIVGASVIALAAGTANNVILADGAGTKRFHYDGTDLRLNGKPLIEGGLTNAADDTAAATAGVPVNGLYRNGSVVMIRVV